VLALNKNLALVLAALALAGCTRGTDGGSAPGAGAPAASAAAGARHNAFTVPHTLRIGDNLDFSSLNPHLATATSLGNLSNLTMAYLVRYDAHNRPMPELATEVPTQANGLISKDGLRITWHLRRGVKWSDGAPFDADDVVWTTNAVNNPANNEIGRDGWNQIAKIDEPDKYTVVYHLKAPNSGFIPTFFGSAGANPCILPKHLLAKLPNFNNADYNSKPVGIGPFRYVRWLRGDRVELERNPYYWRGRAKLDKIVYRIIPDRNTLVTQLRTGEIDLWPYVGPGYYDRIKDIPTATAFRAPGYYYEHLDFNTTHPATRDAAVRRALEYATDRAAIRAKVNHGTGVLSQSQLTPASPMHTDRPPLPFDLAKANQMLDAAGWKRGPDGIRAKNGVRLSFVWGTSTGNPDRDQQIELIRQNWQQAGAQITVQRYQSALFFAPVEQGGPMYSGKWDVTAFAWGMTPDADYTPQNNCDGIPPNGQNVTRLCDPRLNALLHQEKAAYDEPDRKRVIAKLDDRIDALVPYFVLFIQDDIHGYNTDLTGWHPNTVTPFDDMMNVDI
jgi:peptide/nickel transport system substrate-binding protein